METHSAIPQSPSMSVIPHISYGSSVDFFSHDEQPDTISSYYNGLQAQTCDQYSESALSPASLRRISSTLSACSFESDADSEAGMFALSTLSITGPAPQPEPPSPRPDPDLTVPSRRWGAPEAKENESTPPFTQPLLKPAEPVRSAQSKTDWGFVDVTSQLRIAGEVTEESVKAAVKEAKNHTTEGWVSRGSIRSWCTQCGAELKEGRHKMLVLRYQCSHEVCDGNSCTLQAKHLFCPKSGRVYYSTHGSHAMRQSSTKPRRGITVQLKRLIESLAEQGKSPSTIASSLQSTMGEESPTLRQIQNYVFRFKKKSEKLRSKPKLPISGHPAIILPSPPPGCVSIAGVDGPQTSLGHVSGRG
ncbi:hypothetical protein J8273_1119 [Carpediemonas membranifera]|uniref:Uncharacterized protein n=1 Tax=Carpediemonas membranifera TaxID=201153 RepID=A0A8J6EBH5_9EUKA|nr:hypothetical protein J8273_1119 [Carpediemonas membranifera]|eukprot:KAG9397210.1 hypothetical protein J8273_1119 [Carpediemonas membranifera]